MLRRSLSLALAARAALKPPGGSAVRQSSFGSLAKPATEGSENAHRRGGGGHPFRHQAKKQSTDPRSVARAARRVQAWQRVNEAQGLIRTADTMAGVRAALEILHPKASFSKDGRLLVGKRAEHESLTLLRGYAAACSRAGHLGLGREALALLAELRALDARSKSLESPDTNPFHGMSLRPNVYVYGATIDAVARSDDVPGHVALELLETMERDDGISPSAQCVTSAVKALGRKAKHNGGAARINYAEVWRPALNLLRWGFPQAQHTPNLWACNVVLNVLGKAGRWREALEVLDDMFGNYKSDPAPSTSSRAAAVANRKASNSANEGAMGRTVIVGNGGRDLSSDDDGRGEGGDDDGGLGSRASVMEALDSRAASLAEKDVAAAAANDHVVPPRSGTHSGTLPRPDALSFSAVLTACHGGGQHDLAGQILMLMEEHGVAPTVAVVNVAMAAASTAGNWQHALQLMDGLRWVGVTASGAAAKEVAPTLRFPHLSPDRMSYGIALKACAAGACWHEALGLLAECRAVMPLAADTILFNAALQACAKAGKWKEAVKLLQEMHVVGAGSSPRHPLVRPNLQSFNETMHACAVAGEADVALSILHALIDGSVEALMGSPAYVPATSSTDGSASLSRTRMLPFPDSYSYVSALFAFSNAGQYRQAQDLLATMPRSLRSATAFGIVMTQAGKSQDWEGALGLLAQMKAEGVRPDDYSISACLQACAVANTDEATRAGVNVYGEFGSTLGGGGSLLRASKGSKVTYEPPDASSSMSRPSSALRAAIVLFRRSGLFERALELELELGRIDPRAHMAMERRRHSGDQF